LTLEIRNTNIVREPIFYRHYFVRIVRKKKNDLSTQKHAHSKNVFRCTVRQQSCHEEYVAIQQIKERGPRASDTQNIYCKDSCKRAKQTDTVDLISQSASQCQRSPIHYLQATPHPDKKPICCFEMKRNDY